MNTFDVKQIDIKTLVANETALKFEKDNLEKCCFCESRSGFKVLPKKNIFKCFACEKKGNPIEFIRYAKNISDIEAIQYLKQKYSNAPAYQPEPEPETKTDLDKTIFAIKKNDKSKATEYLKEVRKIDTDKVNKDAYFYDSLLNAVVFFSSDNKTINKRLIAPEPGQTKSLQSKGSTYTNKVYTGAYNPKHDKVFLVESPINALSLYPHSAIAIFSTSNHFTDIQRLSKYIENKTVVLAFDNDTKNEKNAGLECTNYYTNFILKNINVSGLLVLNLPPNNDVNDLHKASKLSQYISNTDNYNFVKYDVFKTPLKKEDKEISNRYIITKSRYEVRNREGAFYEISDCIFSFLYRFNDDEGTRLIKLQQTEVNGENRIEIIELPSKDLKKDTFETALSKVSMSFYGSGLQLNHINSDLKHREQIADIIQTYGWQPDYNSFAFTDCVINQNNEVIYPNSIGIVNDNRNTYYLPTASPVNKNKFDDIKQFRFKQGSINFKTFAELFYTSNKVNGGIGIQFSILSLFRDIVYDEVNFFPYLFLYGEAGAGKTSYVDILLATFGDESKGHGLKNISQAALSRIASQKRNTLIYLKEYSKEVPNYVEDYLKTGYDGQARTISVGGISKDTISFAIESSSIIDSNFLPTNDIAVFTRNIILDFDVTTFTPEQTTAFQSLNEATKQGLAQITKELLKYRKLFRDNFKDVYYSILSDLKHKGLKKQFSHERTIKHIALILTPYQILSGSLEFPYSYEQLEHEIIEHANAQESKLHAFKSTNVFWQALAHYKNERKVLEYNPETGNKDVHFLKKMYDSENGAIFIKSNKLEYLITNYSTYCKLKSMAPDKIDKPEEIKHKLLSKGYEPYQPNAKEPKRGGVNNAFIGYSYEFRFKIKPGEDGIYIDNQLIDL